MEKAGNFIRFLIVPTSLFFIVGLVVALLAIGLVFLTIGILRHLKNQWANNVL